MPSSPSLPELNERSRCYQCHTRLAPVLGAVINQDEDTAGVGDKSTLDVHHETEIHFNGTVKLDNGITMRAHTEL